MVCFDDNAQFWCSDEGNEHGRVSKSELGREYDILEVGTTRTVSDASRKYPRRDQDIEISNTEMIKTEYHAGRKVTNGGERIRR